MIEKILKGLIEGKYRPDKEFEFETPEENGGASQEVLFNIKDTNNWIQSDINWSCTMNRGMKGDYLTPDDPNEFILNDIEIENFIFGDGEDENKINLNQNPIVKKLFIKYLNSLWIIQIGDVGKDLIKMTRESIKKYDQFILEWGYGGEGGAASKDPIKVSSRMITEIDLGEEEEEEDKDIPILKDLSENLDYEEEIDDDKYLSMKSEIPPQIGEIRHWKGEFYKCVPLNFDGRGAPFQVDKSWKHIRRSYDFEEK